MVLFMAMNLRIKLLNRDHFNTPLIPLFLKKPFLCKRLNILV